MKYLLLLWITGAGPTVFSVHDTLEHCQYTLAKEFDWHNGSPGFCADMPLDMLAYDVLIYVNQDEEVADHERP